jgi:XTP/dITP diphosphohydrolase
MKLVLGTKNSGKLRELFQLAHGQNQIALELAPEGFDPEETGKTFAENALIKGKAAAALSKTISLGEDSGIAVDALSGQPGIYSARYCEGSDLDRRNKLLKELESVTEPDKRGAAYFCAMALVSPEGELLHYTWGEWRGQISFSECGTNGFGYDPIFYLPDVGKTVAELDSESKNQLSHRAQAWRKMLEYLRTIPALL